MKLTIYDINVIDSYLKEKLKMLESLKTSNDPYSSGVLDVQKQTINNLLISLRFEKRKIEEKDGKRK